MAGVQELDEPTIFLCVSRAADYPAFEFVVGTDEVREARHNWRWDHLVIAFAAFGSAFGAMFALPNLLPKRQGFWQDQEWLSSALGIVLGRFVDETLKVVLRDSGAPLYVRLAEGIKIWGPLGLLTIGLFAFIRSTAWLSESEHGRL